MQARRPCPIGNLACFYLASINEHGFNGSHGFLRSHRFDKPKPSKPLLVLHALRAFVCRHQSSPVYASIIRKIREIRGFKKNLFNLLNLW